MCGIAGYVLKNTPDRDQGLLYEMARCIEHRGPDDEGFYETCSRSREHVVGLAFRRLSIIDLATGHQPMGNQDGSVQIVFNGEIYNYRHLRDELIGRGHVFRTSSDTETIVHAYEEYGHECVEHLRGMFAFAIWDDRRQSMFIARDRFGKKPLYIHEQDNSFLFASEAKAILRYSGYTRQVNRDAVWHYLSYRYVPAPMTLFQGIFKLLPGSCLEWRDGRTRQWSYYRPADCACESLRYEGEDPAGDFLTELDEAVRVRMVSDVPFGAFLSGGIDSSAVVGLMTRHSDSPVKTFSVGFADSGYSELAYAKAVADQFGTDHRELMVAQDDLVDYLGLLVRYRDAPVAEPSDIPIYLLSVEARKSVKMVLTGEGSDEILGGYPKHLFEQYARYYHLLPGFMRRGLFEPLVAGLPYRFRRAKTAVQSLAVPDWDDRMSRWFGALSPRERQALVSFESTSAANQHVQPCACNSALRKILCFDQMSWLPDNLLERGDRMTMAASLEARMPFMDHKLAAFVAGMPDKYRLNGRTSKWLLREAMKRVLPENILNRPKVGFRVPVNEWFRGDMKEYLFDHLTGPSCVTSDYYNRQRMTQVMTEHDSERQNHEKLLWAMLNLEIWHKEYGVAA